MRDFLWALLPWFVVPYTESATANPANREPSALVP